jgi:hypothetical protein
MEPFMPTVLILVYLSAYLTLCVSALREGRPAGDRRPGWLLVLSAGCDVVGGAGVFLYALDVRLQGFWLPLWRGVAGLLALVVFVDSFFAHRLMLDTPPHPEVGPRGHERAVSAFMLAGIAFHLPLLWMNFRLAFPPLPAS